MFEKHEKWFVLGIIALVIYYFYKKGKPMQSGAVVEPGTEFYSNVFGKMQGSLVDQTTEPGAVQPAQATTPVVYRPAQPSGVAKSQIVSAGQFSWYPAPPVLRNVPVDISSRYIQ